MHNTNNTIYVGMPVTYSNGRDAYPYYVLAVSKNQKIVTLARARYELTSYAEGTGTVKAFDPNEQPAMYIAKYGNRWYTAHKHEDGVIRRIPGRTSCFGRYTFGVANIYQDPHF